MDSILHTIIIQSSEEVQHFQGSHKRLRCRGVHEIEVNEIIDTELFQLQDDASQVRSENFRVCIVLHLPLVRIFGVEPECFARTSSSSAASTLLKRIQALQQGLTLT